MDWHSDFSDHTASLWCTALYGIGIVSRNLHSILYTQRLRLCDTLRRDRSSLLTYPLVVQCLDTPLRATTFEVTKVVLNLLKLIFKNSLNIFIFEESKLFTREMNRPIAVVIVGRDFPLEYIPTPSIHHVGERQENNLVETLHVEMIQQCFSVS